MGVVEGQTIWSLTSPPRSPPPSPPLSLSLALDLALALALSRSLALSRAKNLVYFSMQCGGGAALSGLSLILAAE